MTGRDVTFFGEVGAVTSRALWSDSEDEDEQATVVKKWVVSVSEGFSIDKFHVVFVSRSNIQNDTRLQVVSSVDVQEDESSKKMRFLDLYEIKDDAKTGWLVVNQKSSDKMGDGCAEVMRQVLSNCLHKTSAILLIVLSSSEVTEEIKYLQNEHILANHPLFTALKNVMPKKVLPPTIISNPSEAVTFELCTVMNVGSCIFLVPDSNRCNFDAESIQNLPDSMKMVIKSLSTSSHTLSDSNIYT